MDVEEEVGVNLPPTILYSTHDELWAACRQFRYVDDVPRMLMSRILGPLGSYSWLACLWTCSFFLLSSITCAVSSKGSEFPRDLFPCSTSYSARERHAFTSCRLERKQCLQPLLPRLQKMKLVFFFGPYKMSRMLVVSKIDNRRTPLFSTFWTCLLGIHSANLATKSNQKSNSRVPGSSAISSRSNFANLPTTSSWQVSQLWYGVMHLHSFDNVLKYGWHGELQFLLSLSLLAGNRES